MARYLVTFCDPSDNSIESQLISGVSAGNMAIINHRWIVEIYKDEWVAKMLLAATQEQVIENLWSTLGWLATCVNLDSEIMKDLNGGDLSVSSSTQLE